MPPGHPSRPCTGGLAGHGRIEHDGYQGGEGKGWVSQGNGATPWRRSHRARPKVSSPPPPGRRRSTGSPSTSTSGSSRRVRWKIPAGSNSSTATWWTRWERTPEHGYSTKETLKALDSRLPAGWTSRKEEPVRIPEYDEPEPDVAIVRGTDADYRHRIPTAADVALLVEVSETTLSQDRGKKLDGLCQGRDPRLLDRQPGRPPGRGLHPAGEGGPLPVAQGLQAGPASPGHDRRPAAPPDRRRRHPALTAMTRATRRALVDV